MASAAPQRGKFLSPPSSSSPAPVTSTPSARGKFLGKPATSPQKGVAAAGSNAVDAETDSRDQLRAHINTSKIAAVSRRKLIADKRDRVFQDLDEAENIVMSLLECASDVSGALSEMTTAKSQKRHGEKGDGRGGNVDESFEDLTEKVRSNGVGYLAGVKKLHKLLAPHASLVKSYKNHDGGDSAVSEKKPHTTLAKVIPSAAGAANSNSNKIVEEATSNMYAARVKKRLAMERSEILKEMIRLEESERGSDCGNREAEGMNSDTIGLKRKHESTDQ